jgi:ribosomal protein S18 acetylase RimI-like enzyme
VRILTYRDLESKDGLLPLMDQAFRWPFNPKSFEDLVKIDPRLRNGPVGFCGVEDAQVVGFVGVLDLPTRALDGTVEYVGGIYGVATLPSRAREGISTALMNSAHRHFEEKGYRFSFLDTRPSLIAHAFFKKLGYTDVFEYPSAYKVIGHEKAKPSGEGDTARLDLDRILEIFNEFSRDKTGFVIRDKAHMKMLKKDEGITAKKCVMSQKGYAIFRKDKDGVCVRELVALDLEETERLVSLIEQKAKTLVYDRSVLDSGLLRVYESRGYMIHRRSHGVMMVKPLAANASFSETYGDRFYVSGLDHF